MSKDSRIKRFIRKKNLNPTNNRKKVGIILFAASIGLFFLFAFRLSYIISSGEVAGVSLKEKTQDLYTGSTVIKAKRGAILDRNGQIIAEDATSYSLYAVLSETFLGQENKKLYAQKKDYEAIAETLDKYTNLSKEDALKYLNGGTKEDGTVQFQVEFGNNGKNLTLEQRQNIENELETLGIEGIYFNDHPDRIYPNGVFSSHFIGYTDLADPDDESTGLVGKMGLEAAYDNILSGKDGKIEYQRDVYGNPLPGTIVEDSESYDGKDIYTTLDIRLQTRLEALLDPFVEKYEPESVTTMLMEAKTGNILAMAQRPSFEPETKEGVDENFVWRNALIEDSFEPGSTMKIITAAAAIQEGVFNPNEQFAYPYGGVVLDEERDVKVNDWDKGEKGVLTFRQAISWSSNVGMLELERRMGNDKWKSYLESFNFGKSTNSGLPSESAGSLPTDNIVDIAMSSFGQAVSVTNFQMMQAFSAFANDGTMLKPQYISKIKDPQTGEETVTKKEAVGTPVSAQAVSDVRTYMIDTVEDPDYGIAYGVYTVPNYRVAAKTGTAQITENGLYLDGETDYLYSVVEMVPAENPEYILYVTVKRPAYYDKTMMSEIANPLMKLAMELKDTDGAADTATAVVTETSESSEVVEGNE
ncbi:penicillin-binding protein 2 [Enterococcus sp. BWB1-3]|uniref:peptidoglycan D,D-transpeptidase FtsI family protein n=1 Tax=Enterococcus sp. BWB1-3 TaxID=2787713 RepID=UPI0019238419|nr:penicillin-binding protein 2 [Enterococcus sp. BWB1-3]MBL1227861.1 penicillin-binding protein 2 [Enterococcus sp. BWB1-3]